MQASVNDQKDGQENLTTTAILVNVIAVTARLIWSLYDRNDGLRRSPCSQSWFRRLCAGGIQPVVLYLDTFLQWQHLVFTVRNTRSALSVLY